MAVSDRNLKPAGYEQITNLAAAVGLTIPKDAAGNEPTRALIQAEAQVVRWRDDGTNPTTSVGTRLIADEEFLYIGDLHTFKAIETVGGAKLNVTYYR